MQFLIAELSKDEEMQLQQDAIYSIVSPYNSHQAVQKLGAFLENYKSKIKIL